MRTNVILIFVMFLSGASLSGEILISQGHLQVKMLNLRSCRLRQDMIFNK